MPASLECDPATSPSRSRVWRGSFRLSSASSNASRSSSRQPSQSRVQRTIKAHFSRSRSPLAVAISSTPVFLPVVRRHKRTLLARSGISAWARRSARRAKPKPRPTTVKDESDDCCCSQLVTVARADRHSWREDGGRISRSDGRGGPTVRRRIRCPGRHEASEAGRRARGLPSRTQPGQWRRTRASGPGAGCFRREQPA